MAARLGITDDTPRVSNPGPRIVTATEEEIEKLLDAAHPWLRAAIYLCSDTALRSGEALALRPEQIREGQITFTGKGQVSRSIPLSERAAKLISETPEGEGTILSRLAAKRIDKYTLSRAWLRLKKKAGVRLELRMHDLRRTTATKAYRETHDLFVVQQLLGHRNLISTLSYIAPHGAPELRALIEKLKTPIGPARLGGRKGATP